MSDLVLGLDIGGTKLAAGVVTEEGRLVAARRTMTPAADGPAVVIDRVVELGRAAADAAGVRWESLAAVGVGCGGPLDPWAGVIENALNLPGWVNVPLVRILEEKTGLPVHLDNDANAAALGEHRFGAGRGVDDLLYFTLSTGIGAGAIIGGRLYHGANGNAAELGHLQVDYRGRSCHCGGRGCLEAYASGTSIATRARMALLDDQQVSSLRGLPGGSRSVTAERVAAAALAGDRLASDIWDETMELLGAGLASAINAFNPSLVILGGGLTNAGEQLFQPVRRLALARTMAPHRRAVQIVIAELGEHTGVIGAAAVALERFTPRTGKRSA